MGYLDGIVDLLNARDKLRREGRAQKEALSEKICNGIMRCNAKGEKQQQDVGSKSAKNRKEVGDL